jgi:hypothetical protein
MEKIRNFIKKTATITTIVAVVIGVSYTFSPKVREIVDNVIDNIIDNIVDNGQSQLEQIDSVTGITFNEEEKTISFNEVLNAQGYIIDVKDVKTGNTFTYESSVASRQIQMPIGVNTGDVLSFGVTAKGDYINTKNSQVVFFEYELLFVDQKAYEMAEFSLFEGISLLLDLKIRGGMVQLQAITSIDVVGSNATITGIAKNSLGQQFHFITTIDMSSQSEHLKDNYTTASDFKNLTSLISNNVRENSAFEHNFTNAYTNVSQALLQTSAFENYLQQGYTIETMQQKNGSAYQFAEGQMAFDVTGIYKATHPTLGTVTFEVTHQVVMQHNAEFTTSNDYVDFFNDGGQATVINGEEKVFYATIMNHFYYVLQMRNNSQTQG